MQYTTIKGYSGLGALGMLALFLTAGVFLGALIQTVIGMQMVPEGTPFSTLPNEIIKAMKDPKNIGLLRTAQVLGTLTMLFIPALLYNWLVNGGSWFWLGFNKYITVTQIAIGFGIIFIANILAAPLAELSKSIVANFHSLNTMAKQMEAAYNEQVILLSNLKNWGDWALAIIIMAFFPAVFEEVFFRGAMQNLFEKWWKHPMAAIIVSSVIFSIIHFSVYLFISRVILGFVLGLMYYKTRNTWVNIVAHFLNNAIAVSQLFYLNRNGGISDPNAIEPDVPMWVGLPALAILVGLFILLQKYSAIQREKIIVKEQLLIAEADPFSSITKK
ncbi:MAG: CPBP family intramembrane glutamic endopeptidase [Ferruginibacter sp.]